MFWTKQHPREYLDALKVPHPGWPYHNQIVRNERGDREWLANMPGDAYQLRIEGVALTDALLPDSNNDSRRQVMFHDYGPGDTISAPTHVYLRRLEAGLYELRADVDCRFALPGKQPMLSADGGASWTTLSYRQEGGSVSFDVRLDETADGKALLKVDHVEE